MYIIKYIKILLSINKLAYFIAMILKLRDLHAVSVCSIDKTCRLLSIHEVTFV